MSTHTTELNRLHAAFTSRKWQWSFFTPSELPSDLITALCEGLPQIESSSWSARIAWGGVYINGELVTANCKLPLPCKLEYYEPTFEIDQAEKFYPKFTRDQILYHDSYFLVGFKPPGIPSLPAREQLHFNFKSQLENFVGHKVHMPARLDMSASGLLIASLDPNFHAAINRLYETRSIKKYYRLEVSPKVGWTEREVNLAIDKDPRHPVLRRVVDSGGKAAFTTFSLLENRDTTSLLEARPLTGRTHQIRVHAKSTGHPIVGDKFYGETVAPELHLTCTKLQFAHPVSGAELSFSLPQHLMPVWACSRTE